MKRIVLVLFTLIFSQSINAKDYKLGIYNKSGNEISVNLSNNETDIEKIQPKTWGYLTIEKNAAGKWPNAIINNNAKSDKNKVINYIVDLNVFSFCLSWFEENTMFLYYFKMSNHSPFVEAKRRMYINPPKKDLIKKEDMIKKRLI